MEPKKNSCGAIRHPREGDTPGETYYCQMGRGYGTDHPGVGRCKWHGGNTPAQKVNVAKQKAKQQEEQAKEAVRVFALRQDCTAEEALLEEVQWSAGHVAYLRGIVQALESDDGLKQFTDDQKGRVWEKPSVWIELYEKERAHLVRVCAETIKCGVAERTVQLAERQGALIHQVIQAILQDLGVANDPRTSEVVGRNLRLVAS